MLVDRSNSADRTPPGRRLIGRGLRVAAVVGLGLGLVVGVRAGLGIGPASSPAAATAQAPAVTIAARAASQRATGSAGSVRLRPGKRKAIRVYGVAVSGTGLAVTSVAVRFVIRARAAGSLSVWPAGQAAQSGARLTARPKRRVVRVVTLSPGSASKWFLRWRSTRP
ncbi:MAG: hypothetical protein Q8P61_01680, partial [Candidatus Nanopelagicales bacterium]|nr:hypothetical protein [Candidatus Nanopelagicales bacterium]